MTSMLVPGRARDGQRDFYCQVPGCRTTARAYPTPPPICPLHGVPMKQGKKGRGRPLPRVTSGPFAIDIDNLFDLACSAVCARPEIVAQLELLQQPPDIPAAISGQRELILSSISDQQDQVEIAGARLRELLVSTLAAEPDQIEELEVLTAGAERLRDAIQGINEVLLHAPGQQETSAARERQANRLLTIQPYRSEMEAWLEASDLKRPGRRPPPSERAMPPQSNDRPVDLQAALRQEETECRRVLADIEGRQESMLVKQLPAAREQMEFRALVTQLESQERDIMRTLESAMLSVALTVLNEAVAAEAAPRMRVTSLDGLRETLTSEKIVITEAFRRLEEMIRQRRDGSFGIAGPRGVGKSTLIRFFATTPGLRASEMEQGGDAIPRQRPRLGVIVSAPVQYQARDFVLHLYAELCKRVVGPHADDEALARQREPAQDSGSGAVFSTAVVIGLAIFGAGAVTGGLGLLAWAIRRRSSITGSQLADVGVALIGVAAAMLLLLLLRVVATATPARIAPGTPEASGGFRLRSFHGGFVLGSLLASAWELAAVISALTVAGIMLLSAGGGWNGAGWLWAEGAVLLAVGLPALWASRRAALLTVRSASPAGTFGEVVQSQDTQLRELALVNLCQIRFQQSFSSERSMTVKVSGPSAIPVEVDAGGKRGATWEERPKTYPELVADLRAFLSVAAEKYELIMGIDELDKLRSPAAAEDFLNDIKGIFGTTGCFFLVSVSEDAAARFERRGTPFRDAFDSSFDEVISMPYLDLPSARKILRCMLYGWTEPFVGLCYVLSGGLARDLWRIARELVVYRNADDEIELAQASLALCRREGTARLRAVRHELMRDPYDASHIDLLSCIADLSLANATAATMQQWHDKLRGWVAHAKRSASTSPRSMGLAESEPTLADQASQAYPEEAVTAIRLGLEMAAYLLFAATLLEFFVPEHIGGRLHDAENVNSGPKALATLAEARQSLALSPSNSVAYTERFRNEWKL